MSMIQVQNAEKYYNKGKGNELHVVNRVNLELPEHGMVAIFGKSGCGKTTLLNVIGGLDKLNSGSVSFLGNPLSKRTDDIRNAYIGYIFQNYNLNKNETVFENVANALLLCGMTDKEEISTRVKAALANVGMERFRDRLPDTLSGGQQQRVAIARALVKSPAVILADEPTGNLDESNTVMVMDILKELSKQSLVLLVTHEANLVDYYCDQVIEIVDGKIQNVRENSNANGYVQKNKNDIYLGELKETKTELSGVKVSYFGDPGKEIKLSIVNYHGKLYLKSETPELKILDDTSEVHLREGVYREEEAANAVESKHLDFSKLQKFQGKNYGKLFHFGNSIKLALRSIYFVGKKKRGKRLLRASMILLSVVMVFLSAAFGINVKNYFDVKGKHNENLFYLPLTVDGDYTALSEHIGEHGIDYAKITGGSTDTGETFSFRASHFMTASTSNLSAFGNVLDASLCQDLPVLAGKTEFSAPCDVIISSALADDLIESASVSYLSSYEDLVGLISSEKYLDTENMRIIGVVKSNEKNFYFDSLYAAYFVLRSSAGLTTVAANSLQDVYEGEIKRGEAVLNSAYLYYSETSIHPGETVKLFGKNFKITKVLSSYASFGDFPRYFEDVTGKTFLEESDYCDAKELQNGTDRTAARAEFWFSYFLPHVEGFLKEVKKTQENEYCTPVGNDEWIYLQSPTPETYFCLYNYDLDLAAALLYYRENGSFATTAQLQSYSDTHEDEISSLMSSTMTAIYNRQIDYENYQTAFYNQRKAFYQETPTLIINDLDYQELTHCAGVSNSALGAGYAFSVWEMYDGSTYYSNYMLIHASDVKEAEKYLTEQFGEILLTPDEIFSQSLAQALKSIITGVIEIALVLGLLCLCIFFIMRSSFMSRVKEIGILRAVGVSKKNMVFRFGVESVILGIVTVAVGFFASWWFIASISKSQLFSLVFYFPTWLAILSLVTLLAATTLFGVLPALLLLHKTPSEILSKYDI